MSGGGEHKLKGVVVEIIKAFEPGTAADMILSMIQGLRLQVPQRQAQALIVSSSNASTARVVQRRGPRKRPPALPPVDAQTDYTADAAAKLMGMEIGHFRAWYAREGNIEVMRTTVRGMPRCFFKGQAILDARARRYEHHEESHDD